MAHFAPYLIDVLNLPPTYRGKLGLGMFLISLITCKANSGAEKFILEHCLLQELKRFEDGQVLDINNQRYFVQARLKLTILDTAGLKGFLHLANPQNSYWGCWSCRFHSVPGEHTSSVYFGGHRSYLPLEHYLRCLGKTEQCCPIGYYLTDENIINNDFKAKKGTGNFREAFINVKLNSCTNNGRVNVRLLQSCSAEVQDNIKEVKSFLGNAKAAYTTFHSSFNDIFDSTDLIHYHTCDYREQKQLQLLGHQEFKDFTVRYPAYYKEQFHMTTFRYFDLEKDIPYGPFHVLKNNAANVLLCMKGERANRTQQIMAYSEYTGGTHFPHYNSNDDAVPPWLYSNDQQCKIDAYINCIVVPSSLSNQFAFNSIFQQTGFLRCADLIQFAKIVLKLIPFIAPKRGYDTFYAMISEDYCELLAPYFSEEDLVQLQNKLFETVALHEGLFPITESKFTFHQLVHLVDNIRNWGPLSNSSEAAGERAIAMIKRTVPKNGGMIYHAVIRSLNLIAFNVYSPGSSTAMTALNRYNPSERLKTKFAFDVDFDTYYNTTDYSFCSKQSRKTIVGSLNMRKNINFNVERRIVYFDDHKIIYSGKRWKHKFKPLETFSNFEFDSLAIALIQIIEQYIEDRDLYLTSPFYRLYSYYNRFKEGKMCKNLRQFSFGEFLRCIVEMSSSNYEFTDEGRNLLKAMFTEYGIMIKQLMKPPKSLYQNGYIYGINFKSRGHNYRESCEPTLVDKRYGQQQDDFEPSNTNNKLQLVWSKKNHFSSWCCYVDYRSNKEKYGLINFFFRLNVKSDPILHKVPIASICTFKHETNNLLDIIIVKDNRRLDHCPFDHKATLFIPATSFCSTNLLSLGIDDSKLPIPIKSKFNASIGEEMSKHYSKSEPELIASLLLLKLHPERKKYSFDKEAFLLGYYTDDRNDFMN